MMALMLMSVLLAQEPSVEDRVAAFLKGDDAARASLAKAGASAIPIVQKARDKAPEKIDALVFELKRAAAWPADPGAADKLGAKINLSLKDASFDAALQYLAITGVPFLDATGGKPDLKTTMVGLEAADITAWAALDAICRDRGVDYGFFHDVVVVSTPERLWGTGKKPGVFGPPAAERQHLTPDEEKAKWQLATVKMDCDFRKQFVADVLSYIREFTGTHLEFDSEKLKMEIDLKLQGRNVLNVLCLVTQTQGLDFIIQGRQVVIGTRGEIDKKIAGKK